jgi:RNA polymerase sigma factor (sigma-70 family)
MSGSRSSSGSPGGTTSARLLAEAQLGKASALDALFRRHLPYLTRIARGRIPKWARRLSDTNDVVQDAFIKTLRCLPGFEGRGKGALRAYLTRAVESRLQDEYRSMARRKPPETLDERIPDPTATPYDLAVKEEEEKRYRKALSRLRDTDQRLIVAHVELGYSIDQIAMITGRRRVDSARVAVSRALQRLAAEMSRD